MTDKFKDSIEYDLYNYYNQLIFLQNFDILDKLPNSHSVASYVISHKTTMDLYILDVFSIDSFPGEIKSYIGTVYKTIKFLYLIRSKENE